MRRRSASAPLHLALGALLVLAAVGAGLERAQSLAEEADADRVAVVSAADELALPQFPEPAPLVGGPSIAEPGQPPAERVADSPAPINGTALVKPFTYTVQAGDSLATIALQFGIDVLTLLGSNEIDDPDLLPVGRAVTVLPIPGVIYTVAEGDTLNRIAQRYDLAVPDVLKANDLETSELIRVGQDLVLPGAKPLYARLPGRGSDVARAALPTESAARAEAPAQAALAALLAPPPAAATLPGFVWPASGPITTYFGAVGWASPRGHAGLDVAAPWGAPVAAAAAGQVVLATRAGGAYGIHVIIDHGAGLRTLYAHLSQLDVLTGEQVSRGQRLGLVGSTGFSTGPHLHFEIRQHGELRNPMGYLP